MQSFYLEFLTYYACPESLHNVISFKHFSKLAPPKFNQITLILSIRVPSSFHYCYDSSLGIDFYYNIVRKYEIAYFLISFWFTLNLVPFSSSIFLISSSQNSSSQLSKSDPFLWGCYWYTSSSCCFLRELDFIVGLVYAICENKFGGKFSQASIYKDKS